MQWFRNFFIVLKKNWPKNLLEEHYRAEIYIGVLENGNLRVHIPAFENAEDVKKTCNWMLQATHIIAMRGGLKLEVG